MPAGAECCGFAGDRGFLVPELTAARHRARGGARSARSRRRATPGCYSTCRTCEIGMSRAVGPPVPLARPPRARGARRWLTASSTGSRSFPSSPVYVVLMASLRGRERLPAGARGRGGGARRVPRPARPHVGAACWASLCWLANTASAAAMYFYARRRGRAVLRERMAPASSCRRRRSRPCETAYAAPRRAAASS